VPPTCEQRAVARLDEHLNGAGILIRADRNELVAIAPEDALVGADQERTVARGVKSHDPARKGVVPDRDEPVAVAAKHPMGRSDQQGVAAGAEKSRVDHA
jgi:hypothetical protein